MLTNLAWNGHDVGLTGLKLEVKDHLGGKFFGRVVWIADVPSNAFWVVAEVKVYLYEMFAIAKTIVSVAEDTVFDKRLNGELVQMICQIYLSINYIWNEIGKAYGL